MWGSDNPEPPKGLVIVCTAFWLAITALLGGVFAFHVYSRPIMSDAAAWLVLAFAMVAALFATVVPPSIRCLVAGGPYR